MSDDDITAMIEHLAKNPMAGEEIVGTGGCRKLRWAITGNNKGKSGGVRVITFFSGDTMPVFLVSVFGKSQKVSLSKAERNSLKTVTDMIVKTYLSRVTKLEVGATA